jgi:hypothetical protein
VKILRPREEPYRNRGQQVLCHRHARHSGGVWRRFTAGVATCSQNTKLARVLLERVHAQVGGHTIETPCAPPQLSTTRLRRRLPAVNRLTSSASSAWAVRSTPIARPILAILAMHASFSLKSMLFVLTRYRDSRETGIIDRDVMEVPVDCC